MFSPKYTIHSYLRIKKKSSNNNSSNIISKNITKYKYSVNKNIKPLPYKFIR